MNQQFSLLLLQTMEVPFLSSQLQFNLVLTLKLIMELKSRVGRSPRIMEAKMSMLEELSPVLGMELCCRPSVWYKKSSSATRDPEEGPWERLCFSQ